MKIDLRKLNVSCDCAEYFNSKPDFETGWNECPRGEWMIEIASEIGVEKKLIIRTAAECVNTGRHLMKDKRSTNALDKIIAYCDDEITIEELDLVACEAYSTYRDTIAIYSCYDTPHAAYSVYAVIHAIDSIYYTAYSVKYAAMQKNQQQISDICRDRLTPVVLDVVKKLEKSVAN